MSMAEADVARRRTSPRLPSRSVSSGAMIARASGEGHRSGRPLHVVGMELIQRRAARANHWRAALGSPTEKLAHAAIIISSGRLLSCSIGEHRQPAPRGGRVQLGRPRDSGEPAHAPSTQPGPDRRRVRREPLRRRRRRARRTTRWRGRWMAAGRAGSRRSSSVCRKSARRWWKRYHSRWSSSGITRRFCRCRSSKSCAEPRRSSTSSQRQPETRSKHDASIRNDATSASTWLSNSSPR